MSPWQAGLLEQTRAAQRREDVFNAARKAALELKFEYCEYLCSTLLPCAQPKVITASNFPQAWQHWYQESRALRFDPVFSHCRRSDLPMLWGAATYIQAPQIWMQAQKHGIAAACSQGMPAPTLLGARGMLTFARGSRDITPEELHQHERAMAFIARLTHEAMLRVCQPASECQVTSALTSRESDVLRWTGDGKTVAEIALILSLSENTIKFHIKNASTKLGAINKTAAVVKAALLCLLH